MVFGFLQGFIHKGVGRIQGFFGFSYPAMDPLLQQAPSKASSWADEVGEKKATVEEESSKAHLASVGPSLLCCSWFGV